MAVFHGTDGNDTLIGGNEDDIFHSSRGQDILAGEAGYDKAIIDYSAGGAGESRAHNIYRMYDGLYGRFNGAGLDSVETVRIEEIEFHGSAASDQFYVDLTSIPNPWKLFLDAGSGGGFDSIVLRLGSIALVADASAGMLVSGDITLANFEQYYLDLGGLNDDLILAAGNDDVSAGGGNDRIVAMLGNDVLEGEAGGDYLDGGDGNDKLYATDGYSGTDGGVEIDTLIGGAGNDLLSIGYGDSADGGSGTDRLIFSMAGGPAGGTLDLSALFAGGTVTIGGGTITGFEGYDRIYGSNGGDTINVGDAVYMGEIGTGGLFGRGGNDLITTGRYADNVGGGGGNDEIHGGGGDDRLYGEEDNDIVYGEDGADTLYGNTGNDILHGGAGNDMLIDDSGEDQLFGGDGDDSLSGGVGADTMTGGAGNDTYIIEGGADVIVEAAGGGFDTAWAGATFYYPTAHHALSAGAEVEVLTGENLPIQILASFAGNEFGQLIKGSIGGNVIHGGGGNDTIFGLGGDDEMHGGNGNDMLDGGTGADAMTGLGGNDVYVVDAGGDTVTELADGGTDEVRTTLAAYGIAALGHVENLTGTANSGQSLTGNAGDNIIRAGTGNDTLIGGGGNDLLSGGLGADWMEGGADNDVYLVDSAGDLIVESLNGGRDVVYSAISYALANGTHVEVLATDSILATTAINLAGNAFNNEIYGNNGANMLFGGGGGDYLVGWGGDDTYFIQSGGEIIVEALNGGRDVVYTAISYALANGTNVEVLAADSILATSAINLAGNELNNEIYGNNGNNMLFGGGGAGDYLVGWGGDDTYFIQSGGEIIVEFLSGGRDVVYTAIGYTLAAGAHVEVLAADSIAATTAIDLTGNELGNEVYGNNGANTLNGGAGGDYLAGWGGADNFAFTTALGSGNVDVLADFSAVDDTILLENAVFTGLADGALAPSAFVAGAAASDADDRIIYNSAAGQIFFDADGSGVGAQILFATVNPGTILAAGDFTVI